MENYSETPKASSSTEAELSSIVFKLENLREACHQWLDELLGELERVGKLAATAEVLLTPLSKETGEQLEGGSQVLMALGVQFMPLVDGQPVVAKSPLMVPFKGEVL